MIDTDALPEGYKATQLGMLPKDWKIKKLGDIVDFKLGRTPPRNDLQYWENGIHPWVSISDMPDFGDITFTKETVSQLAYDTILKGKMIPKETLFMSFKLTIGRTSILKIDAFHNEAIAAIFPKESEVIRDFLYFYLPTIDYSEYYDTAIKGKTLNKAKIKSLKIPLPPLPEQHAIATTLRTVQEAKERTDAVIAATKVLKAAMMKHMFTYGPVPLEEAEKVALKETENGCYPERWREGRFDEFIILQRGFDITKDEQRNGIVPVVSSSGIKSFHNEFRARGPGVVIGRKGTLGKVFYIDCDYWPHDTSLWVKDFKGNNPKFVYYLLTTLNLKTLDTGTSNPTLNRNYVHALKIAMPDLEDQTIIVSILSSIDQKLTAEQSRREALDTLFTSLLHDLMIAKIRVSTA